MNLAERIYRYFYRKRKREAEAKRVEFPDVKIISVGNITVGGTGKTPAVQWLVRRLQQQGQQVAVVARGYNGECSTQGAVVSDGSRILLDAAHAGDEALLHARSLPGIPVFIGRDRVTAVKVAVENFCPQTIVLDDGFQYWSLAREFDLVLLDARRPFGNGKLLPSGRLREPPQELKRAHGVLLTRCNFATKNELASTHAELKRHTTAPVFHASHSPVSLRDEATGARQGLEVLAAQPVAALSALADNEAFLKSLRYRGATVARTLGRRDHYLWREGEIRRFVAKAKEQGATAVVTTEKDAVKIDPHWISPLPLWSLQIELQVENEEALWQLIQSRIS